MTRWKTHPTSTMLVALGLMLAGAPLVPTFAANPGMTTLAALARQEGWDPDRGDPPNLARRIPRDFPVPASSRDLQASNVMPSASVTGTPKEAKAFYEAFFRANAWRVDKHLELPGFIGLVACKNGQCVNIESGGSDPGEKNRIELLFFKDKTAK